MAKDHQDSQTLDAFQKPRRGRPPTGNAKTAAERMREKRQRDRYAIMSASGIDGYRNLSTPQLLQLLAHVVDLGAVSSVRKVTQALIERAKINEQNIP